MSGDGHGTKVLTQVLTYAQAAALALEQAMDADPGIVALGEDLGRGGVFGQYRGLPQKFGPQRIIDTPISEANIMGAAVGMALTGLKPVVEMRVIDFALCAMDEIVNQAAKNRYMFGGQGRVPMVARMPIGIWSASAAQHSQSLEAWFAHLPGLVVAVPGTPQDNFSLLKASLACGDPVIYMEHKELWGTTGEVDTALEVPLGRANVLRQGQDLTLVTWSRGVEACLKALDDPLLAGVNVDLIDLRTLWPWDQATVHASAAKTGRLLVVHEAVQVAGFGAEIAAHAAEATGCRIARLGAPRIPVGYAQVLENEARLDAGRIARAARALLERR
jgi:pyruvate dehydrogenase E1 component beta subunit